MTVHPLSVTKLRDVLLDSRRWKVVSSLFTPEVSPLKDADHSLWLRKHSHVHPGIEVMIALDGSATFGLLGRVYPATPGTVFIFGPNEHHTLGYQCGSWLRFTHLWIEALPNHHRVRFSVRTGRRYVDTSEMDVLLRVEGSHLSLDSYLAKVFLERGQEPAILRARVVGAVALLAAAIAQQSETPTAASTHAFQRDVVEAVAEHIRANWGAHVALDDLARMSGYSVYYLSRLFRQQTGRTIHEYVDLCRMAKVKELSDAGQTRTRIAATLGFSCLRVFLAWEKRQFERHRAFLKAPSLDLS